MPPYCPACGQEMEIIQQYQRWYCRTCQSYAPLPPTPPPREIADYRLPPSPVPNENTARSRMQGSLRIRAYADKVIPTHWASLIFMLQLFAPVIAMIMVYSALADLVLARISAEIVLILLAIIISVMIYAMVQGILVYKLVDRRDHHFRRDDMLNVGMLEYLDAMSVKHKADINVERWTMNSLYLMEAQPERSPALWAALFCLICLIPLLGPCLLVFCPYFLTADLQRHDRRQRSLNHQFEVGLFKLGITKEMPVPPPPLKNRDPATYIAVTILTLGFFLPYWWYVNIVDMNEHFRHQWEFENRIAAIINMEG